MVTHLLRTALDPSRIWQTRHFLPASFRKHVDFRWDDCWPWTGPVHEHGYGIGPRGKPAHVWSYEKHLGPVPKGRQVVVPCSDRLCVNPSHLDLKKVDMLGPPPRPA